MEKNKVQDEALEPRGAKLKRYMEEKKTMRQLLPPHMAWAHFKSVVFGALKKNPKLLQCRYDTIEKSVMEAATAGLEVNTVLGEASLVPFKSECKLMIEWRGLAKMAWASGFIARVDHGVIRENDKYTYVDGINQKFDIERDLKFTEEERGPIIAYYAMAELVKGGYSVVVMTVDEVTIHGKRYSKSFGKADSGWQKHFDGMAIKTCYRVLYDKKIPKATFDDKIRGVLANQFSFQHQQDEGELMDIEAEDIGYEDMTDEGGSEQSTAKPEPSPEPDPNAGKGNETPQAEAPVDEENHGLFDEPDEPEQIENFAQKANTLCVSIAKAGRDGYAVIKEISGDSDPKKITDKGIQVTVLTALNTMVDNPESKTEIPAEEPASSDYLDSLNYLIRKIEAAGGEWQPMLKEFTGFDVPNEEISTPTKQNVLRGLTMHWMVLKNHRKPS